MIKIIGYKQTIKIGTLTAILMALIIDCKIMDGIGLAPIATS